MPCILPTVINRLHRLMKRNQHHMQTACTRDSQSMYSRLYACIQSRLPSISTWLGCHVTRTSSRHLPTKSRTLDFAGSALRRICQEPERTAMKTCQQHLETLAATTPTRGKLSQRSGACSTFKRPLSLTSYSLEPSTSASSASRSDLMIFSTTVRYAVTPQQGDA